MRGGPWHGKGIVIWDGIKAALSLRMVFLQL